MAGNVVNIKVCIPLKLRSGLTGSTTQSATTHTISRYPAFKKIKHNNEY